MLRDTEGLPMPAVLLTITEADLTLIIVCIVLGLVLLGWVPGPWRR